MTKNYERDSLSFHQIQQLHRAGVDSFGIRAGFSIWLVAGKTRSKGHGIDGQ